MTFHLIWAHRKGTIFIPLLGPGLDFLKHILKELINEMILLAIKEPIVVLLFFNVLFYSLISRFAEVGNPAATQPPSRPATACRAQRAADAWWHDCCDAVAQ